MLDLIKALDLHLDPSAPDVVSFVGGGGKTSAMRQAAAAIARAGKRVLITTTTNIGPEQKALFPAVIEQMDDEVPLEQLAALLDAHGQCLLVGPTVKATHGHKVRGVSPEFVDRLVASAAAGADRLQIAAFILEADGSRRRPIKAPAEYEPPLPRSTTRLIPLVGLEAVGQLVGGNTVHRPERVRALLGIEAEAHDERLTPARIATLLCHPQGGAKSLPTGARLLPMLNKADKPTQRVLARLIARRLSVSGYPSLITRLNVGDNLASEGGLSSAKTAPVLERWGPIATVILAAGESRRMGRAKQLEEVDGEAMVVRAVRIALQSARGPVIVVTGAYAKEVEQTLAVIQQPRQKILFVHNPDWAEGQATSVRCAIEAVEVNSGSRGSGEVSSLLLMPVDQPFLQPVLLRRLQRLWNQGALIAAPLVDGKLRGAPALFDRTLWPEMAALSGDVGARQLLQKYRPEVKTVSVDAEWLRDIDSPADLAEYTCG